MPVKTYHHLHQYRMKPVIKEAIQFTPESREEILDWIRDNGGGYFWAAGDINGGERIDIETHMGVMAAHPGDWIICGLEGEFYPVQDSKFQATYEELDSETTRIDLNALMS
jgi:hypothetical protein